MAEGMRMWQEQTAQAFVHVDILRLIEVPLRLPIVSHMLGLPFCRGSHYCGRGCTVWRA